MKYYSGSSGWNQKKPTLRRRLKHLVKKMRCGRKKQERKQTRKGTSRTSRNFQSVRAGKTYYSRQSRNYSGRGHTTSTGGHVADPKKINVWDCRYGPSDYGSGYGDPYSPTIGYDGHVG